MFSSQALWMLYFFGLAALFFLPTITALIKRTKGLPTVIGLNVLGVVLPVPCWIAAMGFAVCGPSKRPPRRPEVPAEPARMLLAPPAPRAPSALHTSRTLHTPAAPHTSNVPRALSASRVPNRRQEQEMV